MLGGISMIICNTIPSTMEINCLSDLSKLGQFMEVSKLKINKSQIARDLNVDRRTVHKYLEGYQKPETRTRSGKIDEHYDLIAELLSDKNSQVFFYKRILWQYLTDNHGLQCAQSSFRRWISQHKEFNDYFNGKRNRTVNGSVRDCTTTHQAIHYDTEIGEEAQLDWKEDMRFQLKNGEIQSVNLFALVYSYSRFKIYFLSLTKKQEPLFHYLDQAFEIAGGVPKRLKTDNMKTVMDEARSKHKKGVVNKKFKQFADDYGFQVYPCVAGNPWSKGRVEAPMKLWDELYAYNGLLDYSELANKVKELNIRFNNQVHSETGRIPVLHIQKEKSFLRELPRAQIRNLYKIVTTTVKVSSQSMVSFKQNRYSVPPEYIGKTLELQVYDEYLHIYYNTRLVTIHPISEKKWNINEEDYQAIYERSFKNKGTEIQQLAKENLKRIGAIYHE